MKSSGADYTARSKITALAKEGYTAAEISDMVLVVEECVKSFMPKEEQVRPVEEVDLVEFSDEDTESYLTAGKKKAKKGK